mmetsp:Transcript_95504/g.169588  ORF Transcript_95504/g.169588 Transcript_95504/m.169588 type:complete len:318 (+) Transcript_95504:75-1028(+)
METRYSPGTDSDNVSELSAIVEGTLIKSRISLAIFGSDAANAFDLTDRFCEGLSKSFPNVNRKRSPGRRKQKPTDSPSSKAARDCTMVLDKDPTSAGKDSLQLRTASLASDEESEQLLKLSCHPIQKFSQSLPEFKGVDEWRSLCAVFLVDLRQDDEQFNDLDRWLHHLAWLTKQFAKSSKVKEAPALLALVLQHKAGATGQSVAEFTTAPLKAPSEHNQVDVGQIDVGLEEPQPSGGDHVALARFVQQLKQVVQAPDDPPIHYLSDFDDQDALTSSLASVMSKVVKHREGGDYLFMKSSEANDESMRKPCCGCTAM